jgi:hypothetical protein
MGWIRDRHFEPENDPLHFGCVPESLILFHGGILPQRAHDPSGCQIGLKSQPFGLMISRWTSCR